MKKNIGMIIGVIVAIILMVIFGGIIGFWLSYFGGWLLKCFAGEIIANGLNMVCANLTQHNFKPDDIPLFCGTMGMIAGFFKSAKVTSNKKEN